MNVLVLGVGNILLHDEGLGVRAIEELERAYTFAPSVELLDGGTCGLELLDNLKGRDLLIIIDAMKNGGPPGSVYRLADQEVPGHFNTRITPHQLGISDLLATLGLMDSLPGRLVLFGVEPGDLSTGLGLSAAVEGALATVVVAVAEELRRQGSKAERLPPDGARPVGFWAMQEI
ncbi:MAG: hydrogenase maturation protease [Desulfobulbaceae bacterium]|nr:hydrogenase maturation protease [Desulfobulbaceae bacterium]